MITRYMLKKKVSLAEMKERLPYLQAGSWRWCALFDDIRVLEQRIQEAMYERKSS